MIPSSNEFTPYATTTADPQPYLATEELGGPDTYGLSLYLCVTWGWRCGTEVTGFTCGTCGMFKGYRGQWFHWGCDRNIEYDSRVVRCVRDL
jgi:hypothetical protein